MLSHDSSDARVRCLCVSYELATEQAPARGMLLLADEALIPDVENAQPYPTRVSLSRESTSATARLQSAWDVCFE